MSDFKKLSAYVDVPCEWVSTTASNNDKLNQLKAENAKLRQEVERLHADEAHWELGNWGSCPNVVSLQEALEQNAKLRELVADMMQAWWACDNERCPRHDKRCEEGKFCAFDECARDLGIEAGE